MRTRIGRRTELAARTRRVQLRDYHDAVWLVVLVSEAAACAILTSHPPRGPVAV